MPPFRTAQLLPVQPGVGQACTHPFPQNPPFKLSKDGQQCGHGTPGWRRQIQSLSERNETDPEVVPFLKCRQQVRHGSAPTIQAPHQHDIDLPAARRLQQLLPQFPLRTGICRPTRLGDRLTGEGGW